jgi:CRP/FNR family transcriptional regulator, cyclic AMP receptor protein
MTLPEIDDPATAQALLARAAIFRQCRADDLAALATGARFVRWPAGADIVREGDPASEVLIIEAGEARVLKQGAGGAQHQINRLAVGDSFGEMALFDQAVRSATVRADGPVRVLVVPIEDILALAEARPSFVAALVGIARLVAERLRKSSDVAVEAAERALAEERTRVAMGKFTFSLIVAYSLYTWVLGTATQVKEALGRSELVTLPVVLVTAGILVGFMRSSGYPARFFGLTLKDAPRQVLEALLLTLPLMALTVALKMWMVAELPSMQGQPVLQMFAEPAPGMPASRFNPWLTLAYVIFVPFQELIYRGGLQGALAHFLTGRWRLWMAILGSNIIFSAAHLYISPGLSISAFIAGLFWGWLYARQGGLAGVSVSHVLLGFWAFEVVDMGVLE